ncbi:MAG TPA: hypothetical protein VHI78_13270 [Bacteroidales bacterium]|nr:hypothetical protein [Bacteroidales bacterium]
MNKFMWVKSNNEEHLSMNVINSIHGSIEGAISSSYMIQAFS